MRLLTLTALVACGFAQAALPPYWQRAREIEGLAGEKAMEKIITAERRASGRIDKIEVQMDEQTKSHSFVVTSGDCSLPVIIEYQSTPKVVGPAQFRFRYPQQMECGAGQ